MDGATEFRREHGPRVYARRRSTHQRDPNRRMFPEPHGAKDDLRSEVDEKPSARKARKSTQQLTAFDMMPYALLCSAPLAMHCLWTDREFWDGWLVAKLASNEVDTQVVVFNTAVIVLWLLAVMISGSCFGCCCFSRRTHFMVGFAWFVGLAVMWLPVMLTLEMWLRSKSGNESIRLFSQAFKIG